MSWPESHLETEDGESSVGDRGGRVYTRTLTAALYCGLYNVNGKFYYTSNTSLLNLCVIVANTLHIHLSKTNTKTYKTHILS